MMERGKTAEIGTMIADTLFRKIRIGMMICVKSEDWKMNKLGDG